MGVKPMIATFALVIITASSVHSYPSDTIRGGEPVDIKYHPYHVSFMYNFIEFNCEGALIDPSWVLTSSSCVASFRDEVGLLVRVGASDQYSGGNIYPSNRVIVPCDCNDTNADIALVMIASEVDFPNARPVDLPDEDEDVRAGAEIVISGFGEFENETHWFSEILQEVEVTVRPHAECVDIYGEDLVEEDEFCAGDVGRGPCMGDAGAPAVYRGKIFGVYLGEYGCGDNGHPGIFAKVSNRVGWIREVMETYS